MKAIPLKSNTFNEKTIGWIHGFIGVVIFAGSLPATKVALTGFSAEFITVARASIAGLIALCLLLITRQKLPTKSQWLPIALVSLGVVIGFPLFTALALQYMSSAASIVYIGILPLMTALFAVAYVQERPKPLFWLFACCGSGLILLYMYQNNPASMLNFGSIYMLIAILLCGLGYAGGAKVAPQVGGWQVTCWALMLTLPVMLCLSVYYWDASYLSNPVASYFGLGYVALFSMLIGCFFWYKGLAMGGVAAVGQLQLFQPLIGLVLAAMLLHESVSPSMLLTSILLLVTVACAKKYA